jgi:L-serine dehydratase
VRGLPLCAGVGWRGPAGTLGARLAMNEPPTHRVWLDRVIRIMYLTGLDMQSRYKETRLAGLALNVIAC